MFLLLLQENSYQKHVEEEPRESAKCKPFKLLLQIISKLSFLLRLPNKVYLVLFHNII